MDRREFLRRAAVAPVAVGSLPWLAGLARADDDDDDDKGRAGTFVAVNRATIDGDAGHRLAMNGKVFFGSGIKGGGSFTHFHTADPTNPIAGGTWKATRLLSFDRAGKWGGVVAGVLEARVKLRPDGGSPIKGHLRVVCNVPGIPAIPPPAPTPLEGYTLTIPGATFEPFIPVPGGPTMGLTSFSESGKEDD